MVGPVEYVVFGFPGKPFTGEVAPVLADLVRKGTIRLLDLVFVVKDDDGELITYECDALDELAPFGEIDGEVGGLIGPDDIAYVGESLERNSSVALLVWEDLWARPLLDTLEHANGVLLEGARIPHDLIEPALADLVGINSGSVMLKKRPVVRTAVTTAVVAGTATRMGNRVQRREERREVRRRPRPD